jgi:hypothetical protein
MGQVSREGRVRLGRNGSGASYKTPLTGFVHPQRQAPRKHGGRSMR